MSPVFLRVARQIVFISLFSGIGGQVFADNSPTPGELAVKALGDLNGIALACNQQALTARLRDIVIADAPKERGVGEVFEQATSKAFLAQGQSKSACPDGKSLATQVDSGEKALKQAYPRNP